VSETVSFTFNLQEAELTLATLKFVYGKTAQGGPIEALIKRFGDEVDLERNLIGIQQAGHYIIGGQTALWCSHPNCDTWSIGPEFTLHGALEKHLAWLIETEQWERI
jgi:hypothetical protein